MSLTTSAHWMYNAGGAFYDTLIDNSLRFNDGDSAYLVRTPSSNGTRTTWTLSFWVKRCELGSNNFIFSSGSSASNYFILGFNSDDRLVSEEVVSGANNWLKRSSNRYRDVSGWYHVVFVVDTNNGTTSDRVRMYVNNERITSFVTDINPGSGTGTHWNGTTAHDIGRSGSTGLGYYDGYLSEINFIDGQALDPTSFGETKSGVWIPKEYSGSYGTNGFHLEFAGNANDTSGNGNNFTANNISSYDYVPDSPTNNFATFSQLGGIRNGTSFFGKGTLSEGNLLTTINSDNENSLIPFGPASGKWYVEFCAKNLAQRHTITAFGNDGFNVASTYVATRSDGGENATGDQSWTTGDIIGVAYDFDNGKVWFAKNNTWYNSSNPATNTGGDSMSALYGFSVHQVSTSTGSAQTVFNAGQDSSFAGTKTAQGNTDANGNGDFYYTPPSGFLAACTTNLPDPAIDPAQDESPADYFDTVLYTAATTNGTYTHGNLSFQPDFTWIKNRNNVEEHYLIDVVRGNTSVTNKFLNTNSIDAEGAAGVSGTTFSVTSTGYEFVETSINSGELYFNGRTYVGWNWKASGTGSTNNDGSITSTVSVNTDAGFSIVGWNPSTTSTGTVGHGLGVAPKLIIAKSRSVSSDWMVMHTDLASNLILNLNSTAASFNPGYNHFNDTYPTSSVFSIGGYLGGSVQTGDKIAYCFANADGFSKAGSYSGNSSNDGAFVYTGFRPAWVMIKRTDSTNNWYIFNNKTVPYNSGDTEAFLRANTVDTETTTLKIDLLSNGFKPRDASPGFNTGSYVYLAFAEQPFKYANAR